MKWFLISLISLIVLCGCGIPLTNQQIVDEIKFCEERGMSYYYIHLYGNTDSGVLNVVCISKEKCNCTPVNKK